MKPILIIQQIWHDTPDHFLSYLQARQLAHELRRMDAGDCVPDSARDYAGLCLLGGSMSVNDVATLPWLADEIALVRDAIAAQVPVIGHCLGGQLMARALDMPVTRAAQPEIGWSSLRVRSAAAAQRWFGGAMELPLYQWHGESFAIPPQAEWLAESKACPPQAFAIDDRHLAMQFHCEIQLPKLREWLLNHGEEIDTHAQLDTVQPRELQLQSAETKLARSQQIADAIYDAWSTGLRR